MKDRLENLRLFFPVEVTGAYLAIQKLLASNDVSLTESMWFMVWVAAALAAVNAAIYWKLHQIDGPLWVGVVTAGFLIWVVNIDMARFIDMPGLAEHAKIEIVAPTLLVFYTLITSFFELPKRNPARNGDANG